MYLSYQCNSLIDVSAHLSCWVHGVNTLISGVWLLFETCYVLTHIPDWYIFFCSYLFYQWRFPYPEGRLLCWNASRFLMNRDLIYLSTATSIPTWTYFYKTKPLRISKLRETFSVYFEGHMPCLYWNHHEHQMTTRTNLCLSSMKPYGETFDNKISW